MKFKFNIGIVLAVLFLSSSSAEAGVCDRLGRKSCIDVDGNGRCHEGIDKPLPRPRQYTDAGEVFTEYKVPSSRSAGKGHLLIGNRLNYSTDSVAFSAIGKVILCRAPRRVSAKRAGSLDLVLLRTLGKDVIVGKNVIFPDETGIIAISARDVIFEAGVQVNAENDGYSFLQAERNISIRSGVTFRSSYLNLRAPSIDVSNAILRSFPLGDGNSPGNIGAGWLSIQPTDTFTADGVLFTGQLVTITGAANLVRIQNSEFVGFTKEGQPPTAELLITGNGEFDNTFIDTNSFASIDLPN